MNIAVALNEHEEIAHSLKEARKVKTYVVANKEILDERYSDVSHLDLESKAAFIKSERVSVLFINTLDDEETDAFGAYSMQAFVNAEGDPDELVTAYLDGLYEENVEEAKDRETYETAPLDPGNYFQTTQPLAGMMELGSDVDGCNCNEAHECDCEPSCSCHDHDEEE